MGFTTTSILLQTIVDLPACSLMLELRRNDSMLRSQDGDRRQSQCAVKKVQLQLDAEDAIKIFGVLHSHLERTIGRTLKKIRLNVSLAS